jgi:subtilisin family serine protease
MFWRHGRFAFVAEEGKKKEVMKMKKLIGILLFSALLLPLAASAEKEVQPPAGKEGTSKYGYYYKGKFIALNASERLVAVSETGRAFRHFVDAQALERHPLSEMQPLKGLHLGLYSLPTPARKTEKRIDFNLQMKEFARTTGEEIQPVFEQGQALLIPSNEIIVGFKAAKSLEEAQAYFARYHNTQGIVEVKKHRKNSYTLTINNPSNGRVYQVSQFLAGLEEVKFAEPNHIVVMLDVPGMPVPSEVSPAGVPGGKQGGTGSTRGNSPVTWTVLVNESFEETALPAGWSTGRWSNAYTDAYWSVTNQRSHGGSQSIYATGGGTQGVAPPGNYPNNCYSWMNTPTLNLAAYEEVYVELWFYAKYQNPIGCTVYDYGRVGIYDPTSQNTNWLGYLATCHFGDLTTDPTTHNGWRRALLRVSPSLRLNGVRVRFAFRSDNSVSAEGLYIDQVRVVGTTNVDTEPLGNDTYGARLYEMGNAGQIAGLGTDSNSMHVPEAWNIVTVSPNLVVAVIDEGVELTHPDLNLVTGYDHDGSVGGGPRGNHGTAVAGNVGAIRNNSLGVIGTAPGVKIMPVYMGGSYSQYADAIDVAVSKGAHILSNSWGWVGAPSADIEDAITDALNAGRVVVFAAGNGPDRSPWTYDVAFPGNLTGTTDVICVGASSPTDEHKAAASSDGAFYWGSSYIGDGPDIVAPSPWSYTTDRLGAAGYNDGSLIDPNDPSSADYTPSFGGTSSATPKVAGIAALLLSVNPNLTPAQVKSILRFTANDIDAPGIDDKTGAGRVNAHRAVVPTVVISTPSRVKKGDSFTVKVTGSAPFGIKSIWWFGQGTGIPGIDQAHWQDATGGPKVYSYTWTAAIDKEGTYRLAANARDVLYPNPGDGYPHQASEGSGIATTEIKVTPLTNTVGLLAIGLTLLFSGVHRGRKRK